MNCTDFQFNSIANQADSTKDRKPDSQIRRDIQIFFSVTRDLQDYSSVLEQFLSADERKRAGLLHFVEDKNTYSASHGMLRLLLSKKTGKEPSEIEFLKDENNKPGINDSNVQFNITHTRDAFAIALSDKSYIGIDLEKINRFSNVRSLANTYFSNFDRQFIHSESYAEEERFMLLWTRKEALLKAVGIGILTDLRKISVYQGEDPALIKKQNSFFQGINCEGHYIYSGQIEDYILSVAVPSECNIIVDRIGTQNLRSYLHDE